MRDLEIRGAGNLLGTEQHGHIEAVGFEMYCQLLKEAIEEIKGTGTHPRIKTELELKENLYISEQFVSNSTERLNFYRRISKTEEIDEVDEIEAELRDRYGVLPEAEQNLVHSARLCILGGKLSIKKFQQMDGFFQAIFDPSRELTRSDIEGFVSRSETPMEFSCSYDEGDEQGLIMRFKVQNRGPEGLMEAINILQSFIK